MISSSHFLNFEPLMAPACIREEIRKFLEVNNKSLI
jgi:hypothetical protein